MTLQPGRVLFRQIWESGFYARTLGAYHSTPPRPQDLPHKEGPEATLGSPLCSCRSGQALPLLPPLPRPLSPAGGASGDSGPGGQPGGQSLCSVTAPAARDHRPTQPSLCVTHQAHQGRSSGGFHPLPSAPPGTRPAEIRPQRHSESLSFNLERCAQLPPWLLAQPHTSPVASLAAHVPVAVALATEESRIPEGSLLITRVLWAGYPELAGSP